MSNKKHQNPNHAIKTETLQTDHTNGGKHSVDGTACAALHERNCPAADEIPRLVIRGERLSVDNPDPGESVEIRADYKNKAKFVRIPLTQKGR